MFIHDIVVFSSSSVFFILLLSPLGLVLLSFLAFFLVLIRVAIQNTGSVATKRPASSSNWFPRSDFFAKVGPKIQHLKWMLEQNAINMGFSNK